MEEFFRTLADNWVAFSDSVNLFVGRIRADEQAGTILAITIASAAGALMGFFLRAPKPVDVPEKAPDLLPPPHHEEKSDEEPPHLIRYRESLTERNITGHDQDLLVREFAKNYSKLVEGFRLLTAEDPDAVQLLDRAEESLYEGDVLIAVETLDKASEKDSAVGRDMKKAAERRLTKSAAVKEMAGDLEMAQLNYAQAAEFYREAAAMAPNEDARFAEYLNKHGQAAFNAGALDAAAVSFEKAAKILMKLPQEETGTLAAGEVLSNLAMLYYNQGDLERAEKLYNRALKYDEKAFGEDHEMVAKDLNNLALLYKKQGKYKEAEPLLKRSITIKERLLDPSDPSLITGLKNYAALLRAVIRDEEEAIKVPPANDEPKKETAEDNPAPKPLTIKPAPKTPAPVKPAAQQSAQPRKKAPPPPPMPTKLKNKPKTGGVKALSGAAVNQKPQGPQIKNVVRPG